MKKSILSATLITALLMTSSCFAGARTPVTGFLYSDVKGGESATISTGGRIGISKCVSYLGLIGLGDCSIEAAKRSGQIKRVSSVDYHTKNILGLYAETTTIVNGK